MPGIAIPGYLVMPDELGSPCESAGEDESNAAGIRTTARPGPSGPRSGPWHHPCLRSPTAAAREAETRRTRAPPCLRSSPYVLSLCSSPLRLLSPVLKILLLLPLRPRHDRLEAGSFYLVRCELDEITSTARMCLTVSEDYESSLKEYLNIAVRWFC
jgi:hypothetical protein